MKMKDTEKAILVVLVGIAALALSIFYFIKPNIEEKQAIDAECVQLDNKLQDLLSKEARREEYLAGIDTYNDKFEAVLSAFPPDLKQEVTIMFVQGIRDDNDFDVSSLGLGMPEQFYTLGLNGGDALLEGAESTDGGEGAEGTEGEAGTENAEAGPELVEGEAPVDTSEYRCYRAAFPIAYSGSYDSLKEVINYVNNFSNRMAIDTIDIAYDAEGDLYSGNLNMMCYSIESDDRPQTNMELNEVEIGIDNIFIGSGSGSSASSSLTKYDENDGAAITSNYDFYTMLNPATSDVSAKVVGQNGTGKEASVISNSDNSVSSVNYDFYELDGKNYCKYTVDNSTSYEAEVTSAEDVKILLQSSSRKDDDDKVGIRVTIRNTTTIPVYIKISGDDAVNPRVNIVSKTGAVKVY